MALNIEKEVAVMRQMAVVELRRKFAEVFGEETRCRNKDWLVKRIAWRLQANEEGDLSERARRRAMEIANDADLRVTAPRPPKATKEPTGRTVVARMATRANVGGPLPGTVLTRDYKGRLLQVTVLADGFEFEGERYKSLSAIAKQVTGSHWNGRLFFGLQGGPK